jgi:hypothetical protein
MDVDLFEYLYCFNCYHITQVSGSTPLKNCVCAYCDKSNIEFERLLSEDQKKNFIAEQVRRSKKKN